MKVEAPAGILPKISINLLDALAPVLSLSKLLAALRDIFVRNYGIQEIVGKLRELAGPSDTGRVAISFGSENALLKPCLFFCDTSYFR